MAHRQTVSFLRKRFEEAGIRPITRHGQNFLVDLNLLHLLADSAELGPQDVVLEVGTGTGSLTAVMAPRVAAVVTVEIDARMAALASEELVEVPNVVLLQQDALRNKNHFHQAVLDAVRAQLEVPGRRLKLVANLPYSVATPVISNLLRTDLDPVSLTVTIQKELADRITAGPGTKDYGALSVWIQSLCEARVVRIMPPSVFWPRPKVDSAILHIVPVASKRAVFPDLEFYHRFVRSMFFHRRKFLRSVLLSGFKGELDKPAVDELMAAMELGADARAEQLDLDQFRRLCELVRARVRPSPGPSSA